MEEWRLICLLLILAGLLPAGMEAGRWFPRQDPAPGPYGTEFTHPGIRTREFENCRDLAAASVAAPAGGMNPPQPEATIV